MNTTRTTRIAITSGAAALCLGVAVPAYACTTGGGSTAPAKTAAVQQLPKPTLQQEQSWVDSFVTHRMRWLDHLAAVASADQNLTPDQQASFLAGISKAKTALQDFKTAVDAATSTGQVRSITAQAMKDMPFPIWPHAAEHWKAHRHALKRDHAKADKAKSDRTMSDHAKSDEAAKQASPTDITVASIQKVNQTKQHKSADHDKQAWVRAHSSSHRYRTGGDHGRHFGGGQFDGRHAGEHHFAGHGAHATGWRH